MKLGPLTISLQRAGAPAKSTAIAGIQGRVPVPFLDASSSIALSAVWRCVTLIADAVSDMPWSEWKGDDQVALSRLVRRPLVTMARREWTWRVVATEALWSTAHVLHVGGSDSEGAPWGLLPIPPAAIAPSGYQDPYQLLPPARYTVGGLEVDSRYVTPIRRHPWPGVPDWMNGILNVARAQFTSYLAADMTAVRYWMAGGPVTTVLTSDAEIDDEDAEMLAQRWVERRAMGNEYPAVLGMGAHAEAWGADPTKEASVEARREINAEVGRYFGIPTRILNAPAGDSETYSNVEHDAVDLYRYALRGYIGPVEDAISELLPGDPLLGRRLVLDPTRFLQGDLLSRAQAYPPLVMAGILTVPEVRVRGFGLSPAPADPPAATQVQDAAPATVTAEIR